MRRFIQKLTSAIALSLLAGVILIPTAFAEAGDVSYQIIETDPGSCADSGAMDFTWEELLEREGVDGTTFATESSEILMDFDDVITDSDGNTLSAVYWKFTCYATEEVNRTSTSTNDEGETSTETTTETITYNETFYSPYTLGNGCPDGVKNCALVQIIFGDSGTGILQTYIAILYRWAAGLVGIVAVLVIVVSGIQISIDQGGGEQMGDAKNRIIQSLAALAILFLSALILYTVNPTFFTI
jgi:hypothetical protein